ncbi:hypothetical protein Ssi02_63710 [Sinosporangium siamense]|uniref:Uncharacterized protein n=1 Tax=Sinosporangium siamense TaxID=1367973 RepID=A0A919RNJ9_9ACTN|nr:hypothetical protein Ssi02_63710 [Sinosporangium siamense]
MARLSHTLATLFTSNSAGARPVRRNRGNVPLRRRIVYGMAGFTSETATTWAWLSALGLTGAERTATRRRVSHIRGALPRVAAGGSGRRRAGVGWALYGDRR